MHKGDLIGDRYRLDRSIGQGGSGRIWLAHDTRLDRRVAIKFLLASNAYRRVRYARRVALEAKIAASIQHRNVVQIFDFGSHSDETPYIVMEALTGFTLGEAFDEGKSFSLDTLIHIMSEVLQGLVAVHDAGIVHRDLKPENIFLVKDGRDRLSPKLLDFGISRSLEPESRRSAVTTTEGMIIGTPQYMSPEQARGDMRIDKGTDIYSIGTIMFEAFAGVVPFPATNVSQLLISVIQREPPAMFSLVPQIGKPLCDMIDKALKKDRNQRYADAAEMHDALLAAAERVPPELDRSTPMFPPEKIRERVQSRRPRPDEGAAQDDEQEQNEAEPSMAPATRETVHERSRARRQAQREDELEYSLASEAESESDAPRPPLAPTQVIARSLAPARYALPLGLLAVLSLGVAAAAIIVLRDRTSAPVGTGMIVVQAPPPSPAAPVDEPEKPAQPDPAAKPVNTAVVTEPVPAAPQKRVATTKPKKTTAPASDSMQQMTSGVASAFAKQKGSVIECLNKHPDQVEGSPQLTVRVSIDKRGKVTQAELLPEAISRKSVGGCVTNAVAAMSFPTPDQPMTFRVPLTWRRK